MSKVALVFGISGQDGSYISELLLEKGYEVWGMVRRTSHSDSIERLKTITRDRVKLRYGDMTDPGSMRKILMECKPDEVYNLAAQSHVRISYDVPDYTAKVNAVGVVDLLSAIQDIVPHAKFYQASTSEMFGRTKPPQNENSLFQPTSPYGTAKLHAYWEVVNARQGKGLFACNGILFNHESERRGENFVTRKITSSLARIKLGQQEALRLGNLDAKRDWGHSKDYCVDLDTLILTPNGFKSRDEIRTGDTVINYNLLNNKWEIDIIEKIHDVEYCGEMFEFHGNGFVFRCSKNHRMIYQRKTCKSKNWGKWLDISAKKLFDEMKSLCVRSKYNYRFPGYTGLSENINNYDICDDFIKLIGYVVTEGCLSKSKTVGGGTRLSVSQSVKKYYIDLKTVIQNLKLTYTEKSRPDGVSEFVFDSRSRDEILQWFDGMDIHKLPLWIYSLSKRQAGILFKSMMDADGCWSAMSYCSKRFELARDFSFITNFSGYRTKIKKRKSGIYDVTIFSHSKKSVHQYITGTSCEDTHENLWCIKTKKNGTVITYKQDSLSSCFISGNCNAMHLMLQQPTPEDYVIATGEAHTVREFLEKSFQCLGIDCVKEMELGNPLSEKYIHRATRQTIVEIDPRFYRPVEVDYLLGDSTKARKTLGWAPQVSFDELVRRMCESDLKLFSK
jgi:GDP-mannose 4,6-dehydratase